MKQSKPRPVVGQTLYSLNVGNAARHGEQKLTPLVVKSVGRKYFTCGRDGGTKWSDVEFHLDDWSQKTEFCRDYQLYASAQEWADEKESHGLCYQLWRAFEYGHNRHNVSLPTLRKIAKLLTQPEIAGGK
jgi:hypothetical protein